MNHYCDNIAVDFLEGESIRWDLKNSHRVRSRSSNFQKKRLAASGSSARLEQRIVDGTRAIQTKLFPLVN